jgi:hypothetical protein
MIGSRCIVAAHPFEGAVYALQAPSGATNQPSTLRSRQVEGDNAVANRTRRIAENPVRDGTAGAAHIDPFLVAG